MLEPNQHFKYSNIGCSLLGIINEAAAGVSWRRYVQENIVDRLGLKRAGPDRDEARLDDFACGYSSRVHGSQRVEIEHIDTLAESSATGVYSNASDITAYFQAQLDGDERLISDASKRRMRQVQWTISDESQYGLGLSISTVNGRTCYGHSGGYPGHITMSKLDLERRLSISVFTNSNDGPAEKLTRAILHLIDLALDAKREAKTEPRPAEDLARFESRFAALWGLTDVVNVGGRLYLLNPALDNRAGEAIEMEVISDTELKAERQGIRRLRRGHALSRRRRRGGGLGARRQLVPAERFTLPEKVARPA